LDGPHKAPHVVDVPEFVNETHRRALACRQFPRHRGELTHGPSVRSPSRPIADSRPEQTKRSCASRRGLPMRSSRSLIQRHGPVVRGTLSNSPGRRDPTRLSQDCELTTRARAPHCAA
jgi:hypothetical protein